MAFFRNLFNTTEKDCSGNTIGSYLRTIKDGFTNNSSNNNQINYVGNDDQNITDFVDLSNDYENVGKGDISSDIKTLKDALRYFKLEDFLQELEDSLENVRRHTNNQEIMDEHNSKLKRFDKYLLQLCKKHHPDKIQGSEEEKQRAQKLQTALNATRKAINILNKIFLEDIAIDHKYGFYTNLDISLLGNEDEIEGKVYEVLFKISLISEIKQSHIIAEIRNFLTSSRSCIKSCIESFLENNGHDFYKYFDSAVFRLKQCIGGYEKLLLELKEVEEECGAETTHNMYSLIRSMRYKCSQQMDHLKEMLAVSGSCLKGSFGIFTCPEEIDDYFVSPFVFHVNVMLMCNVFMKKAQKTKYKIKKIISHPIFNEQTDFLAAPYYLTTYFGGNKVYEKAVQQLLNSELIDEDSVKNKFLAVLLQINEELINKFNINEYSSKGTTRFIAEELKKCKEMMSTFEQKKKDLKREMMDVKNNTKEINQQVDEIINDQRERHNQLQASLLKSLEVQKQYEILKNNSTKEINRQLNEIQSDAGERLKKHQAFSAEIGNQELDKITREEEHRKKYNVFSVSSEHQTRHPHLTSNVQAESQGNIFYIEEKAETRNQNLDNMMREQEENRKKYEACLTKNSELQTRFLHTSGNVEMGSQEPEKMISKEEVCCHQNDAYLAENTESQGNIFYNEEKAETRNQKLEKMIKEQEDNRKKYEAVLAKNSELLAKFAHGRNNK